MKLTKLSFILFSINLIANDGTQVGNDTRKHFGNNFTSTIANPMTSDTPFTTIDGSKSFNANLTCSEQTKSFLDISYSGSSDITVYVNVDTNLDGTKNKSFSFSGISGIGTNGVIKCSTNSWNNCNYYLWTLSNNNLSLISATRYDLGGGYCINSSCGSLASSQGITILDTIGGAISSMYQQSSSQYLITKTSNDGSSIEFYGQNYQDCTNFQETSSTPSFSPENDSNLDTTTVVDEQSNDDSSVYYTFNKGVNNQSSNNFDDDIEEVKDVSKSIEATGDTSDYSFTYSAKQKDEDGNWVVSNGDGKLNIDFLNPDIKYCEIKFIVENTVVFSDGNTHHSSVGDTQTWKTKIVECTGDDYSICPYNSSIGEIIKHPCGDIDNFAEVTSILMAVEEATDDFSCSE